MYLNSNYLLYKIFFRLLMFQLSDQFFHFPLFSIFLLPLISIFIPQEFHTKKQKKYLASYIIKANWLRNLWFDQLFHKLFLIYHNIKIIIYCNLIFIDFCFIRFDLVFWVCIFFLSSTIFIIYFLSILLDCLLLFYFPFSINII